MAQVDGCWANVLDDCDGELEDEHIVSVFVWRPPGGVDTRKARERKKVEVRGVRGAAPSYTSTVRKLKVPVLCSRHNRGTTELDTAAGRFARAVDEFVETQTARSKNPLMRWALRDWSVDGNLIERWMLKTLITNGYDHDVPIGGTEAAPGRPTRELVEIVYGLRPIERPMGIFGIGRVGDRVSFGEEFSFVFFTRGTPGAQYYGGAVLGFRTLRFGWQFERRPIPPSLPIIGDAELDGAATLQPIKKFDHPRTATRLSIAW